MPGLNLTRDEAMERSQTINVSHYDVSLDLTQGDTHFRSCTTVTFDATPGSATFADLVSSNIHSITLNTRDLGVGAHQDHRIALTDLAEHNILTVDADCQYMHTGEGLHRFVDPADGKAYTYSQFEVPDARRVYTTFEQPDLKATFAFTVTVPQGWKVFSNSPTPEPQVTSGGDWLYVFETTAVMSTYVTAIIAGPYEGVTSSLTSSDGREIPLGAWCRASLIEHLDHERIFEITKQGFEFFEPHYGIAYPFTKYDQIFVPEYNAGAMENAGCITFRDSYVFRTEPTRSQLEQRANTILHELAHMWFGDLVTMKWWNDLWLNESFAEFMSYTALSEATEFTDGWTDFLTRKDWGLTQDQLPTTHPIMANIQDLADVEVNFDGITYAKGACVLRQLVSYVGRDAFLAGLHEYLTAHSFQNATLQDLLTELEKTSGRDLTQWSKEWLEEAGVTLLSPIIETDSDNKITRLAVQQESFTPGSSLRTHRLIVAGYSLVGDNHVERVFSQELDVSGEVTEVLEAVGIARPDLILVNDCDLAYVKLRLDPDSLQFALSHVLDFKDSLMRNIVLASAWDMTRDAQMDARRYIDLALLALAVEDNISMLQLTIRHIEDAARTYVCAEHRLTTLEMLADALLLLAQSAPASSDQQKVLVRAAARNALTERQLSAINALYTGTETLMGLNIDIDLQWSLLNSLASGGVAGESDIASLEERDDTMTGHQNAAMARASVEDVENKRRVWEAVLHDKSIPNDTRWSMVAGMWAQARTVPGMYRDLIPEYFASIDSVWDNNTFHTAEDIITYMFPSLLAGYIDGVDIAALGNEWIAQHPDASGALIRIIRERVAVVNRMIAAQQADRQS